MPKSDEISSTRKLLTLIRGKPGKAKPEPSPGSRKTASRKKKPARSVLSPGFRKRVSLGVEIGNGELRLAAVTNPSEKRRELLACDRVAFKPDLLKDRNKFQRFVRAQVVRFCGSNRNARLWCVVTSANVETRYLRIPRVPRKQIANTVLWSLRRYVNVDTEGSIFDFELLGEVIENGATKIEVIAYTAPAVEVQSLRRLFVHSGFVMEGISIVPFALQNFYRTGWTDIGDQNVCNLFIGRDWSRITIYSNHNLVLAREIKAGIRGIIESVRESVGGPAIENDSLTPQVSTFSEEELIYFQQLEADATAEVLIASVLRGEEAGEALPLDLQDDRLFGLITPAVERMVRQIERTIQHFSLNFENQTVSRVFVSGVLVAYPRIVDYIGRQLGLPVAVFDPFDSPSSIRPEIPAAVVERDAFVPAVGMALSSNQHTPNFIHTFADKERVQSIRLVNRLVVGAFAVLMALGIAYYSWLDTGIEDKRQQVSLLRREATAYPLSVTQDMILQAVIKIQKKNKKLNEISQRYLSLALIREVSDLTPAEIRLVGVILEMGGGKTSTRETPARRMILDGIVFGDRLTFDAGLGGYILRLKNSPLFVRPTVKSKTFEYFENKEVLRFRVHLDLG